MRRVDGGCVIEEIEIEHFDEEPIGNLIEHLQKLQSLGFTHVDWDEADPWDTDNSDTKMFAYRRSTNEELAERAREQARVDDEERAAVEKRERSQLRSLMRKYGSAATSKKGDT